MGTYPWNLRIWWIQNLSGTVPCWEMIIFLALAIPFWEQFLASPQPGETEEMDSTSVEAPPAEGSEPKPVENGWTKAQHMEHLTEQMGLLSSETKKVWPCLPKCTFPLHHPSPIQGNLVILRPGALLSLRDDRPCLSIQAVHLDNQRSRCRICSYWYDCILAGGSSSENLNR